MGVLARSGDLRSPSTPKQNAGVDAGAAGRRPTPRFFRIVGIIKLRHYRKSTSGLAGFIVQGVSRGRALDLRQVHI